MTDVALPIDTSDKDVLDINENLITMCQSSLTAGFREFQSNGRTRLVKESLVLGFSLVNKFELVEVEPACGLETSNYVSSI